MEDAKAKPDSFLFYQPENINNSFLDSMSTSYDKEISLKMQLLPPPPAPAPKTKKIDGFRVQLFAGLDSLNAASILPRLENSQDSLYFFKEKELFKIQLGDYMYRNDADMKVLALRKQGFNGAWVVQRLVNIAVDSLAIKPAADSLKQSSKISQEYPFKIQVLVTSDLEKAKNLVSELGASYKQPGHFVQSGSLYKVFLGQFKERGDAQKLLTKIKNEGFPDAWLVY